jgi:major membrane immunogen (membrane-anchored lipoprotein)
MKKIFVLFLSVVIMIAAVAACGEKTAAYKPGTYQAEAEDFDDSGYKESVTVTVDNNGKITAVNWDGIHQDGGPTKKEKGDDYGMKAASSIGKEWYEQAAEMESWLIKTQDPAKIPITSDGYADGISGCTIHINGFVSLASEALAKAV